MDHRLQFVAEARRTDESFTALCARHGIAPKTGYKWLARYDAEGPAGLHERSRRPHTSPTATAPAVADALLELRRRHPTWGGKKLLAVLARRRPRLVLPAPSTVAALLARAGLVAARRRRRSLGHPGRPSAAMDAPNAVWTADFKGEFKTRDGVYCYPLTVADGFSRCLLACRALPSTRTAGARPVFERLFREHGLPARIRTDNGVPGGSAATAGSAGTTRGSTSATCSPRSPWLSRRSPRGCGRCTLARCGSGAPTSRCSRPSTSTTAPPAETRAACYRCPWTDPSPMSPDRTRLAPNVTLQWTRYDHEGQRARYPHRVRPSARPGSRATELRR
jgi:transposase-like protein